MSDLRILILWLAVCWLCSCSTIIDHERIDCADKAWTVADMQACQAKHEYHKPTLTDIISQPITELERAHRKPKQ